MVNFYSKRKSGVQPEYKKIFIYCEGSKTEPLYFEGFKREIEDKLRKKQIEIVPRGSGRTTLSLVNYAIQDLKNLDINESLDEVWVVFDEDTCKGDLFDNAIKSAAAHKIQVAYSNECFELWYLLHYELLSTGIGREIYFEKLSKHLGIRNYKKTGKSMTNIYELIKSGQSTAIKHAKYLLKMDEYKGFPPSKQKPSTTVHLLVLSLNKLGQVS